MLFTLYLLITQKRNIFSFYKAKRIMFSQNYIYDYYGNKTYHFKNPIKNHYPLSAEHVVPKYNMFYNKRLTGDLHNLIPVNRHDNSRRSKYPFIEGNCENNICVKNKEVKIHNSLKGTISRIIIYFYYNYCRDYNLDLNKTGDIRMFVRWCTTYPVSMKEVIRNEYIKKVQGNSNPFIEDSSLCLYFLNLFKIK